MKFTYRSAVLPLVFDASSFPGDRQGTKKPSVCELDQAFSPPPDGSLT